MGDTDNAMSAALARETIINFFQIENNRLDLFKKIVKILEQKDDDFFYIKNNKEKFESFRDCIVHGHFQWIIDVSNNQKQTEFDSTYTDECFLPDSIYKNFYQIFNSIINEDKSFSKRAKRLLIKYSNFIAESPK